MSIYEFHYIGGMPFMVLLSIVLLSIIGLIALTLVRGEGKGSTILFTYSRFPDRYWGSEL